MSRSRIVGTASGAALAALSWVLVTSSAAPGRADAGSPPARGNVEIRRTTDGIAHLRATDWRDLGYGIGFVQAQDALCTLAEAFVTYRGQRSTFFGPEARPALDSTLGRPRNLELDLFFLAFADAQLLARFRAAQPPELNEISAGFAAGFNRYLRDMRAGRARGAHKDCRDAAWVREIEQDDVYRRMYAVQLAAGYGRFIPEIVNAQPGAKRAATTGVAREALRARLTHGIGGRAGLGSNGLAFGQRAAGVGNSVLFGNPHWYWGGPDRFYQMHLTIPGQLDVAGVAFLGVPLVMIGFNEHVAWTHTVSTARRYGLFDVQLDADPIRYRVDGRTEPMQSRVVTVQLRAGERSAQVTRVLYRTRFGPLIDLGEHDPAFGWGAEHALSVRDVNADNFRVYRTLLAWNRARSLPEFIAIQRREAAIPWANTLAIGRGDGRVWYADIGAIPNVPDALRADCTTALARKFAVLDDAAPLLDGSRSRCAWRDDPGAAQAGAMPASALPSLLREDYVANMNNSYWLSNVHQPLEGFPAVLGGERKPLSLRTRLGHRMALRHAQAGSADILSRRLMQDVLSARAYSAELFKDELLAAACEAAGDRAAKVAGAAGGGPGSRITDACRVLRRWSNAGNASDRGALLWDAFWNELSKIPERELYLVPFTSEAPLETPRGLNREDPRIPEALAAAVAAISHKGWPLDAPLASQRYVHNESKTTPLYGGCHAVGYFTVACNDDGSYPMGPSSCANSYLQVVRFSARGVQAHTLLAHGQQETALESGDGDAPVLRYAHKRWLRFPFSEREIARDPGLVRSVLRAQ